MVSSDVELCNLALEEIGASRIAEVGESTKAGVICESLLYPTIEEILEQYDFSDAVKRAEVSPIDEPNLTVYNYVYQLPNDCLRILCIIAMEDESYMDLPEFPYMKEGRKLYCDQTPCGIKYIYRPLVKDLSSLLVTAIKHLLASRMALKMTQDRAIEQFQYGLYQVAFEKAINIDGRSRSERQKQRNWSEEGR